MRRHKHTPDTIIKTLDKILRCVITKISDYPELTTYIYTNKHIYEMC